MADASDDVNIELQTSPSKEAIAAQSQQAPAKQEPTIPIAVSVEPIAAPVEPIAAPVIEPIAAPVIEPIAAPVIEPIAATTQEVVQEKAASTRIQEKPSVSTPEKPPVSTRAASSHSQVSAPVSEGKDQAVSQVSSVGGISQLKSDLNTFLTENKTLAFVLDKLDGKTGLKREQLGLALAGGFTFLISLYLLVGSGAAYVSNILVGVAYPATASLRALKSQDKSKDNQLLAYWSIFGGLLLIDLLLSEVSGYFLVKSVVLLALLLPQLNGAELVYEKALEPAYNKVLQPAYSRLNSLLTKKSE